MINNSYLTTSIPYVNAAPHLGHALEFVQADVLARHRRQQGGVVRLLSGTDDNAMKNVTAAQAAGVPTAAFVDANASRFAELITLLEVSLDDFIRTGSDPRHRAGVQRLWRECAARGDFYQREYTGLYCLGCEQFYDQRDLAAGWCLEHRRPLEQTTEVNWFFRLSRYSEPIEAAIRSSQLRIEPAERRNEVLALINSGLVDISVSRPATRADGWGIPVPDDHEQVIYVWWDALANYVTALDYGGDQFAYQNWWRDAQERIHVIGKGITRFHAVYWLGLLLSAQQPLPTTIFVHEYVTEGGAKISKSAGTTVNPRALIQAYSVDAVRWWLLRDVARLGDTDFTIARLVQRYNQDLAGGLGNLVSRCTTLVRRFRDGSMDPGLLEHVPLLPIAQDLPSRIGEALDRFDLRAATAAILAAVAEANCYLETERPWELGRAERETDTRTAAAARLDWMLTTLVATARAIAAEVQPFLPSGAERVLQRLGRGASVGDAGSPAFARISP